MPHPEAIIVGAGPSGISTALFLVAARPDLAERVVVIDRATFPREKICAGGVGGRALRRLEGIGVRLEGVPHVPLDGVSIATRFGTLRRPGGQIGVVVRRSEFDHALVKEARRRGVRVEEGVKVNGLTSDAAGVSLDTSSGPMRAKAVVGADGVGSAVRRALGFGRGELSAQAVEVDTEGIPADGPRNQMAFDIRDGVLTGYSWDFPTRVDGQDLWCRGTYALQLGEDGRDVGAVLDARLREQGLDPEKYRHKRFAVRGLSRHEPRSQPRVLLVGEAAGVDPLVGEGIAHAIGYGALAGPYLADKLRRDELSFRDWAAHVSRSTLGYDLAARVALIGPVMGRSRAWVERAFVSVPETMDLLLAAFAGQPLPLKSAGLALGSAGRAALSLGLSALRGG